MKRLRNTLVLAAAAAALAAPTALAAETSAVPGTSLSEPASEGTIAPYPLEQGDTLAPPETPQESEATGGTSAAAGAAPETSAPEPDEEGANGAVPAPSPSETFDIPSIPSSSCATSGVPPILIPIYNRAANAYGLGPQGPSVLASINGIESAFGSNMGPSSAGAVGWMQFLPSTWETSGSTPTATGSATPTTPKTRSSPPPPT